jgi:hypothetical protein
VRYWQFSYFTRRLPKTSREAFREPLAPECLDNEIHEDAGPGGLCALEF